MIKRAAEMEKEIKVQMRGGKGSVEILHVMKPAELGGKCRLFARITLNEGCSIGEHVHENEEEIFYILSGNGHVNDNGEETEVHPGDAILTGGGKKHAIRNIGSEPLVMTAVILLY
jgi:mannose-6-phosphate isomerase-like protein (cupin superfamily)